MSINHGSEMLEEKKKLDDQVISNLLFFIAALHHDYDNIHELLRILNKRLDRLLRKKAESERGYD